MDLSFVLDNEIMLSAIKPWTTYRKSNLCWVATKELTQTLHLRQTDICQSFYSRDCCSRAKVFFLTGLGSDTRMWYADLSNQPGQPSSIQFRFFDPCPSIENYPKIRGFLPFSESYTSSEFVHDPFIDNVAYHKAYRKGQKSAGRVARLLNGEFSPRVQRQEKTGDLSADTSFVRVGDYALVGGPPRPGHAKDIEGISSYRKIEFNHPRRGSNQGSGRFASTQFLHFSVPSLKAEEVLFSNDGSSTFDTVEIISGTCLFSAKNLSSSISDDGHVHVKKLLDAKPTMYEMEYIARSSSTIADVAATIVSRKRLFQNEIQKGFPMTVNITLDVPSFHYYAMVAEKLDQGLCTTQEALQWLDAIERRYKQVAEVYQKSVVHNLKQRGAIPLYDCPVRVSPRNTLVNSAIHQSLQDGQNPSVDDILQKLWSEEDEVWRNFYELVPQKERPHNFRELGYLFYVFQIVKPVLSSRSVDRNPSRCPRNTSKSDDQSPSDAVCLSEKRSPFGCLLISIDDSAERRIYTRVQKLLKIIRNSPGSCVYPVLVEMYLCRRVFINGNRAGSNLYLDDPSPEKPILLQRQDCKGVSKEAFCPASEFDPSDVVRSLYGSECARNLQLWFDEAGGTLVHRDER